MPKIEIETCSKTPNFDALEAVAKTMRENYLDRTYLRERELTVSTGRKLRVVELDKNTDGICDCRYTVTLVHNAE